MRLALTYNNKIVDYIIADESYINRLSEIFPDHEVIPVEINEWNQLPSIGEYYINEKFVKFMKIAPLTVEQYRLLFNKSVEGTRNFALSVTPEGLLCIPEEDVIDCTNENLQWVSDLVLIDYTIDLPDTTPPQMTGYGILIPTEAETLNLFPDNQFNLGGFEINLTQTSQGLAVDLGYLNWQGFRDEQDKPQNATIKASFSALWYELLSRYNNNEIIQL